MNGSYSCRTIVRWRAVSLLSALVTATLPSAAAQSSTRYFCATGHYLRGAFRSLWGRNCGLAIFGHPITEEFYHKADGRIAQYFERARFELTVRGNQAIIDLGLLGVEATGNKISPRTRPFVSTPARRYFPETEHSLQGEFKGTWERHSGLRIFGFPISEEISERLADGWYRTVQYFKRARFDLWPNGVQWGLLRRQPAPRQLRAPWQPNSSPDRLLSEDGSPRPPSPGPAHARAALRVQPGSSVAGRSLAIEGEGFAPGERVSLWLTAPDQSVRAMDVAGVADANGSISPAGARVNIDAGFGAGVWHVTAQGVGSGRAAVAAFRMDGRPSDDSSKLGVLIHDNLAARGNAAIVPLAARPGSSFLLPAALMLLRQLASG